MELYTVAVLYVFQNELFILRVASPQFTAVTVGDRSFAVAGPRLWNSLPVDVQSASSLATFRQKLKTYLFRPSYPDVVM